jgi:hypothetical protein
MAQSKDRSLAEVKRIRRKLSARLMKAHKAGRLDQEMQALHREANATMREAAARAKASRQTHA